MFTGLRVGVTTAKVLAQALRIPVIPIPSLDLLAYPLRHSRTARRSRDRRSAPRGVLRDLPTGARRRAAGLGLRARHARGPGRRARRRAARRRCCAATASLRFAPVFADLDRAELAGTAHAAPSLSALAELAIAHYQARGVRPARRGGPDVPAPERRRDRLGPEERLSMVALAQVPRTARGAHRADAAPPPPRRCCASRSRCTRGRGRIRCSSASSRCGRRASYVVAKVGRDIVGYAGLDDVAHRRSRHDDRRRSRVAPARHRHAPAARARARGDRARRDRRSRSKSGCRTSARRSCTGGSGSCRSACARATTPTPARTRS